MKNQECNICDETSSEKKDYTYKKQTYTIQLCRHCWASQEDVEAEHIWHKARIQRKLYEER